MRCVCTPAALTVFVPFVDGIEKDADLTVAYQARREPSGAGAVQPVDVWMGGVCACVRVGWARALAGRGRKRCAWTGVWWSTVALCG